MTAKKTPVFLPTAATIRIGMGSPVDMVTPWEFGTVLIPAAPPQGRIVTLEGPILDASGIKQGSIKMRGMPVEMLRQKKPAGRKNNPDRKVEVFLAWLDHVLGNETKGRADQQVADLLRYADARQVKAIRAEVFKTFSISSKNLNLMVFPPETPFNGYEYVCLAKYHSHEQLDSWHLRMEGWRWNGTQLEKGGMTLSFSEKDEELLNFVTKAGYVTFCAPRLVGV
ncbi:MAG: hypothetical protein GJU67_01150 [Ferrovum sp.]|jgi:hypothetical protein|nr:hypothetical protein [Ferrovum sp.]